MKHAHKFRSTGGSTSKVRFLRCECGEEKEVALTKREQRAWWKRWKASEKQIAETHRLWRNFCKRFKTRDELAYRWKCYDLMTRIRRWAPKHPEVQVAHVDDSYHSNSDIVVIPHARRGHYMGATCVYIPQCSGEDPIEFFLYPSQQRSLEEALAAVRKRYGKRKGWR